MKLYRLLIVTAMLASPAIAFADSGGLGDTIQRGARVFAPIAEAIGGFAYIAGLGLLALAAFLFKGLGNQQDQNPKRAIGIVASLIAGVWLLYLPSSTTESGDQFFGSDADQSQSTTFNPGQ